MIPNSAYDYCCEDISLIENYEEALADKTQTWICHHRKGIELNKTPDELKAMGLYENRPACELMFLTQAEHKSLHHKGKHLSQETREKLSISQKKRFEKIEEHEKTSKTTKKAMQRPEVRKKISIGLTGIKQSQETRDKKSKALKGKKRSDKTRANMSAAKKGISKPKYYWLTLDGEIKIMNKAQAHQYHPDWKLIGPVSTTGPKALF